MISIGSAALIRRARNVTIGPQTGERNPGTTPRTPGPNEKPPAGRRAVESYWQVPREQGPDSGPYLKGISFFAGAGWRTAVGAGAVLGASIVIVGAVEPPTSGDAEPRFPADGTR